MIPFYKKISLIVLLTIANLFAYAQSTVFSSYNTNYASLNPEQKANYDKMIAQTVFKPEIKFMSYDPEALFDDEGIVKVKINSYLDEFEFKATHVHYETGSDFTWRGQYFNYDDTTAENNHAILSFLAHNGRIFGTIQVDHKSYQIYDLTGGVLVLAEYIMEDDLGSLCGVNDVKVNEPMASSGIKCQYNKTRILVIYTNGAAAIEPDIWGKAHHGIGQIKFTASESALFLYAAPELAGVEVLNLTEGTVGSNGNNRSQYDIQSFKSNPTVVNLRNIYKADIVVFMTKPVYGDINGTVQVGAIGCSFDDAFAISNVTHAISGRKTFAHEIMHLFGARHDDDPTMGFAHGTVFKAHGKFRYTLMASLPSNKSRIDNLSNPNVNYMNKSTGAYGYRDNVKKVSSFVGDIGGFYSDVVTFNVTISMSNAFCDQYGTATAVIPTECKDRNIKYTWKYSDNGTQWFDVPGGTTQTINTFVPYPMFSTMNGTFNSRQYRVVVLRGGVTTTANATAYYTCGKKLMSQNAKISSDKNLKIFPNPSNGLFSVTFDIENDKEQADIKLIDVQGRVVKNLFSGAVLKGLNNLSFDQDFTAGIYFIKIETKSKTFTGKLIVQ